VANPLRGVSDADYVASALKTSTDPSLVGHSYGGSVITNAVNGNRNVKALVYVAGFCSWARLPLNSQDVIRAAHLTTLAPPVELPDGKDLTFSRTSSTQFAADVPANDALMASTQRPITEAALNEASGAPAWKSTPSWFIYGDRDLNIPPAALSFMANRANSKETVVVNGASHVVMVPFRCRCSHRSCCNRAIDKA